MEDHRDIQVQVSEFNQTSSVEYLTPSSEFYLDHWSKYYAVIANYLVKYHCFKRNNNLFAASYDFRTITSIIF